MAGREHPASLQLHCMPRVAGPVPSGPGDELPGAGHGEQEEINPAWLGEQKGLDPAQLGGGECGVLSSQPVPFLGSWDGPPVLLLIEGLCIIKPLREPQHLKFYTQFSGLAEPQGHADGHYAGSAAPSTALHVSPSPATRRAPCHLHQRDVPPCEGGGCHLHPPITGMSPGHVQPPALPARPPAAGTSHQLFLALQRCSLPAMAPCITIIAGCQRLEAGSQDRGGAPTPLATSHSVPAGSALQQAISGNPM